MCNYIIHPGKIIDYGSACWHNTICSTALGCELTPKTMTSLKESRLCCFLIFTPYLCLWYTVMCRLMSSNWCSSASNLAYECQKSVASTFCKLNFNVWEIFNSEIYLFYVIIKHRGLYSSISLPILLCLRFQICHNPLLFLFQQFHRIWYTENTQALKCYEYVCRMWDPQENLTGILSKETHHIKTVCWWVLCKKSYTVVSTLLLH